MSWAYQSRWFGGSLVAKSKTNDDVVRAHRERQQEVITAQARLAAQKLIRSLPKMLKRRRLSQ
jgi:hypothetical protein